MPQGRSLQSIGGSIGVGDKKAMLEITNSLEELRQEYFTEKEETLASISFIKKTLNEKLDSVVLDEELSGITAMITELSSMTSDSNQQEALLIKLKDN